MTYFTREYQCQSPDCSPITAHRLLSEAKTLSFPYRILCISTVAVLVFHMLQYWYFQCYNIGNANALCLCPACRGLVALVYAAGYEVAGALYYLN